jgi:hypothetical protein
MTSMSAACTHLASTGLGFSVLTVTTVAIACLFIGIVFLWARKRQGRRLLTVLLVMLGLCAVVGIAQPSSAHAATTGCVDSSPAFTIVQTSTIGGLAPGTPVLPITGTGTNSANTSIYVDSVAVRIVSVTKSPLAAHGTCDASDYVIQNPEMPIGETVAAGQSVEFGGASIGFSDRATNQDACKGATVHLRYDANES